MALSRAEKEDRLQELETVFRATESAILVDFTGMDVPAATELRRQVRSASGQYRVVKNTVAKRALAGTSFEPLIPFVEGTTAVAYSAGDPVALAKVLTTFSKTEPALRIKVAIVQGQAIRAGEVAELAALPGRPELYSKLLFVFPGPDDAAGKRAQRRAAGPGERLGAGGEEARRLDEYSRRPRAAVHGEETGSWPS